MSQAAGKWFDDVVDVASVFSYTIELDNVGTGLPPAENKKHLTVPTDVCSYQAVTGTGVPPRVYI